MSTEKVTQAQKKKKKRARERGKVCYSVLGHCDPINNLTASSTAVRLGNFSPCPRRPGGGISEHYQKKADSKCTRRRDGIRVKKSRQIKCISLQLFTFFEHMERQQRRDAGLRMSRKACKLCSLSFKMYLFFFFFLPLLLSCFSHSTITFMPKRQETVLFTPITKVQIVDILFNLSRKCKITGSRFESL